MGLHRSDVSEMAWKWRCKLLPANDTLPPKTTDSVSSSSTDDPKSALKAAKDDPASSFGVDATIKTLYEGQKSVPEAKMFNWVDYPPRQISKSVARVHDRVAIKVYKVKDREKACIGGKYPLRYHQLDVQSPALVAALAPIVKKEDVYLEVSETAVFTAPFRPLFFCQDEIVALWRSMDDDEPVKAHLDLLVRLLDDIFGEVREKKRRLQESGLVSYKLAWTYFPRGATVYSCGANTELLTKVESTEYSELNGGSLNITTKVVSFNGEEFVWRPKELAIPRFAGNMPIAELEHYPLEFNPDGEQVKARLRGRGTKVLDFQDLAYCTYNGIGLQIAGPNVRRHNVEGRILVDVAGYKKYHLTMGKREDSSKDPENVKNVVLKRVIDGKEVGGGGGGGGGGSGGPGAEARRLTEEEQGRNREEMLRLGDEVLIYMSPVLEGYALKNKMWLNFFVEDIEPMVWNDEAFDHLVYDEQQKDLVLSFVENHGRSSRAVEDVIMGKGQGLVVLLSGPPGTGKTLTAEAVADRTHRPLFYLQAEDLGINAATLGENLKRVFSMANDWDAVVLLDEADVFMSERSPADIVRNELVSIFLREVEYFRGILFLTTNLYSTIDSAFRSRVSLHLLFRPLGAEARMVVWRKFLERVPGMEGMVGGRVAKEEEEVEKVEGRIAEEDLKELALWQMNGREIKNAVKMVKSWCDNKGYAMSLARLENGIKVTSPHASKEGAADDSLYD